MYFERALPMTNLCIRNLSTRLRLQSPGFGWVGRVTRRFPIHIIYLIHSDQTLKDNITKIITTSIGIMVILIVFKWYNGLFSFVNQSKE